MGFKRPFDDVDFQELPYKHSRQLEFSDKHTPFSDVVSCYSSPRKPYVSGTGHCAVKKFSCLAAIIVCFLMSEQRCFEQFVLRSDLILQNR